MSAIDPVTLSLQWALSYPFARPQQAFIFVNGASWPLLSSEGGFGGWRVQTGREAVRLKALLTGRQLGAFEAGEYHAVAAVGSNAAPGQLRRKFAHKLDDVAIPVIEITVPDHIVAYANRLAAYGSVPATLVGRPGGTARVWATLLSDADYETMNATEDRGEIYDGVPIAPLDAPDAVTRPFEAYACLTGCLPLRVSAFASTGCAWPVGGQWEAQSMAVQALGLDLPVDRFVTENVTDANVRAARDLALSQAYPENRWIRASGS
ncbi:hypothetical protein F1654_09195 [Alkalicaulis satelles]|uniref:Uncharacterized protein n=1 Tax=Alkalicaulis satelles TaxID=2609175 RepID=A0A5M6ZGQ6_9PROT|nr:hypothetical protein [Alkalicaulis satelles]KAA5803956.1 hypothetical protein F1654_09195 [Alkalicaulis satelles]